MIILTIRTDKPEAEIGLFDDNDKLAYRKWQAHRQLAETLHQEIQKLLNEQKFDWAGIGGIVCYKGPGSFTGLRIGLSVANALAYTNSIPIIVSTGKDWLENGISTILAGKNDEMALPEYGAEAHITKPRE